MVALTNLPIGADFLDRDHPGAYVFSPFRYDESLAVITVQDVAGRQGDVNRSEAGDAEAGVADGAPPIETHETSGADAGASGSPGPVMTSAPVLRPSGAAGISGTPSEDKTRKLLRHAYGPPTVDEPPEVRAGSMLVRYPISALKKAIEGLVIARFVVETSGRASGVTVVKGLDPECDAEVVEAVENARFVPGRRDGKEVPAYSQITVRFVLDRSGSPKAF